MNDFNSEASALLMAYSSATSISHLPRRCWLTSFPLVMSGRLSENHCPANSAGDGFQNALQPFQHGHVIRLASRLEDTGHHADREHRADAANVFAVLCTHIVGQPRLQPRLAVPAQPVEIIADRVKATFAGALLDGLVDRVLADPAQALRRRSAAVH